MLNTLVNKLQDNKDLFKKVIDATPKSIIAKIPPNFDYKKYLDLLPYVDANGVVHNMPKVPSTFKVGEYTFKLSLFRSPTPSPDKMYTPIESYSRENYTPLPSTLLLFESASYRPIVKNQGSTSQCVAYSSALMREYQQFVTTDRLFDLYYAPEFIYNLRSDPNADGMCLSNAMSILEKYGNCTQKNYYNDSKCPTSTIYSIPSYGCVYFQGMSQLPNKDSVVANIKNALYNNGPCILAFIVYQPCNPREDPRADGRIWLPLPDNVASCESGGHCMTIIGWDDSNGFLIQNSWGPNWNGNGCVWLPYDDILQPYGPLEIWSVKNLNNKPYAKAIYLNPPPSPEVTPIYYDPPSNTPLIGLGLFTFTNILIVVAVIALISIGIFYYFKKKKTSQSGDDGATESVIET
jgi:C1A family cysteine protease